MAEVEVDSLLLLPIQKQRTARIPINGDRMLDHIDFGTRDYQKSRDFYVACLAPLDIRLVMEIERQDGTAGAGFGRNGVPRFWLGEGSAVEGRLHVAFGAESRGAVDAFYREALKAGARSKGAPGLRTRYAPNWYAAFVYDLDGHTIEAVHHDPGV